MKALSSIRNITAVKAVRDFGVTNAPSLLTGVGVVGTVATAYFAGTASFKANDILREAENNPATPKLPLDTKAKVKLTWQLYLPAAGVGAATVTSIVMANRISTKRLAAALAAYSVADRAHTEYKDKVEKHFGKNKEQKVRDEMAQDEVAAKPSQIVLSGPGKVICFDRYTGREFESTMEDLRSAENDLNEQMLHSDYVSLTDFYCIVGLPATTTSDSIGWRADKGLVKLDFSTTLSDKGEPVLAFEFRPLPQPGYDLAH